MLGSRLHTTPPTKPIAKHQPPPNRLLATDSQYAVLTSGCFSGKSVEPIGFQQSHIILATGGHILLYLKEKGSTELNKRYRRNV